MRYTVGIRTLNKKNEIVDGFYVFGAYGLPFIATSIEKLKPRIDPKTKKPSETIYMPVLSNLEQAKKYVSELSKAYYREFHERAKLYDLDIGEFKFYLKKVDSSKLKGVTLSSPTPAKNKDKWKYSSLLYYKTS